MTTADPITAPISADEVLEGIHRAVRERKFEVVPVLMKMLAARDPSAAQAILDALDGAVTIRLPLRFPDA